MKPHYRLAIIPFLLLFSCKQYKRAVVNDVSMLVVEGRSFAEPPPPPGIACGRGGSLKEWFVQICKTEKPDIEDSVTKYRFVLYDNGPCYLICLLNRKDYPQGDSMSAHSTRRKPVPVFTSLSKTEYKGLDWLQVMEKVTTQLGDFVMIPEYRKSSLAKATSIIIQFDNESMLRLQKQKK